MWRLPQSNPDWCKPVCQPAKPTPAVIRVNKTLRSKQKTKINLNLIWHGCILTFGFQQLFHYLKIYFYLGRLFYMVIYPGPVWPGYLRRPGPARFEISLSRPGPARPCLKFCFVGPAAYGKTISQSIFIGFG